MKWKGTEYSNDELMARIDADVKHMLEMSKKASHHDEQTTQKKNLATGKQHNKGKAEANPRAKSSPQYKSRQTQNIRHSANCPNRRNISAKSPSMQPNQRRGNPPNINRRDQQKQNLHDSNTSKEQQHSQSTDKKPLSIGNDSGSKDILNLDNILSNIDSIINRLLSSLGIDKDTALILLMLLLLYHNEADITLIFAMLYLLL